MSLTDSIADTLLSLLSSFGMSGVGVNVAPGEKMSMPLLSDNKSGDNIPESFRLSLAKGLFWMDVSAAPSC